MKSLSNRKGGFTLIELMIVVAIIGILAAIAIPNFVRFQLRAKSSEGKMNLAAIRTAEEGYFAEFGTYVLASLAPAAAATPTSVKQAFTETATPGADFNTIGWAPEGQVYFQYAVNWTTGSNDYTADAVADIDADTAQQVWGYARTTAGATPVVTGLAGTCAGAWDVVAASASLPNQVGPCDANSGQSVF